MAYLLFHASVLNQRIAQIYYEMQDLESKQLIAELLTRSDFLDRFHRYASSVVLSLAYGKRMPRGDESEIKSVDEIMIPLMQPLRASGLWMCFYFSTHYLGFLRLRRNTVRTCIRSKLTSLKML